MRTSVKNAVSDQSESKLNHFKQPTERDKQRSRYREEGGESRTQGQGYRWIWALTELKGRQAEGPVLRTSFFLNELYRGNARKFIVLHIFNNLL
jgi:hypothetical protein